MERNTKLERLRENSKQGNSLHIGVVTFNGLKYVQNTIAAIKKTCNVPYKLHVVDGGSTDGTREWLACQSNIETIYHKKNLGFAAGINDLADAIFSKDTEALFLLSGSDVMPYPHAIDLMVNAAETTDADWIFSHELRVWDILAMYPDMTKKFGNTYILKGDTFEDYLRFKPALTSITYPMFPIADCRNFVLMKSSLFWKCGYADEGYWPNGYFEDNDYCELARLYGVKTIMTDGAWYFHFWSRTAFEGGGMERHLKHLNLNRMYYTRKWGGNVGSERLINPQIRKLNRDDEEETNASGLAV